MIALLAVLATMASAPVALNTPAVNGAGGDSVTVGVAFSGTGGTITRRGLYTAGEQPGRFRVIATSSGISDTAVVTLVSGSSPTAVATPRSVSIPTSSGRLGIPFGAFGASEGAAFKSNTDHFTLSIGSVEPDDLAQRIAMLRAAKHHLLMAMTGGAHANYTTDGVFDINKWKARMNHYDTPAIKAALAAAVADGTIIGNSVMDEPQNTTPGKAWGPAGTMTKARVDEMCGYVKGIFPTLPVGVVHDHRVFEPDASYKTCDFIVSQYRWSKTKGDVAKFRDDALALGRRDGIAIAFSLNILDGGVPKRRAAECPIPETGGPGTAGPACRMTAAQVREWGLALGPAGCALTMWRYDPAFMSNPENVQAFNDVAAALAKAPAKPCRRS